MNSMVRELNLEEIAFVSGGEDDDSKDNYKKPNNLNEDEGGGGGGGSARGQVGESVAGDIGDAVAGAVGTAVGVAARSTPAGVAATIFFQNLVGIIEAGIELNTENMNQGINLPPIGPG